MREKVTAGAYLSLDHFEHDFEISMSNIMALYPYGGEVFDTAHRLYRAGIRLVRSLHQNLPSDSGTKCANPSTRSPVFGPRAIFSQLDPQDRLCQNQKVALMKQGPDGSYYFSSGPIRPLVAQDKAILDSEAQLVQVSFQLPCKTVPQLEFVSSPEHVAPTKNQTRRRRKSHEIVEFLAPGAFLSFKPDADATGAFVSQTESSLVLNDLASPSASLNLALPVFAGDIDSNGGADAEQAPVLGLDEHQMIHDALSEEAAPDFDISSALVRILEESTDPVASMEIDPVDTGLAETQHQILKLIEVLEPKFGMALPVVYSDDEIDQISSLQKNLSALAEKQPPGNLVDRRSLSMAMLELTGRYEIAFRGTLPSSKPHAFVSQAGEHAAIHQASPSTQSGLRKEMSSLGSKSRRVSSTVVPKTPQPRARQR
ncbi:uncharacterized protein BJ171DRAFT_53401 [Polychytrium aggregatum]|uniref:uncharacterized protein n=1 Tax=Polychytrium aggregatum TaxID=110093 RepID=UPI0022FEBADC|nr:uncharacterized protein BJ171DRAFT_53401 [Polychytrium aggregatum]KAI9205816.1 hypothetical protein BJ171DRAFT_53401 [Polychytrium aggregatum]